MIERPQHRMTLRQLMTHSEKVVRKTCSSTSTRCCCRTQQDFRDLSRPIRRRSHYPTLLALHNALEKLREGDEETQQTAEYLLELLQEIREHARRERINRR